jgi:hypothetical protein
MNTTLTMPEQVWVSEQHRDGITPTTFAERDTTGTWRCDIVRFPGERKPYRLTLSLRNHVARKFWAVETQHFTTEAEAREEASRLLSDAAARADAVRRQLRRHRALLLRRGGGRRG